MSTTSSLTTTRLTRRALVPAVIAAGLVAAALSGASPASATPVPLYQGVSTQTIASIAATPAAVQAALEALPDHARINIAQDVKEVATVPAV